MKKNAGLFLLLILMLPTISGAAQSEKKPLVKRTGSFKIRGRLLGQDGKPIKDKIVTVAPLVEGDQPEVYQPNIRITIGKSGHMEVGAGQARTDQNGRFEVTARRKEFESKKILFFLLIETNSVSPPKEVRDSKTGKPMVFSIGERAAAIDIGDATVN